MGQREYDFGAGGKVTVRGHFDIHDLIAELVPLGEAGARVARYINNMKELMQRKDALISELKGETVRKVSYEDQAAVHHEEFPNKVRPPDLRPKPQTVRVFSEVHTAGPWRMSRSGMIRVGADWICAVTARNRIYNGPLIEAAPDMLAMLERMLSSTSPQEARTIIADATALVTTARRPAWERSQEGVT